MSAPDKEPQPLGSTSGKRGYIRTCVRCGVTLYGVGRRAKYCPECRAEVNREMAMDYRSRNPEKVRAAYERQKEAARTQVYCQRCGCEIDDPKPQQKWCQDCKKAVKAQQSRQSYIRRHEAAPATKQLICQRCGQPFEVPSAGYARAKYCPACRPIVESERHAASYERKKSARTFGGPYMTNSRPADVATRAAAKAQVGEDRLRLLSNVADWAGISYGQLMLKSPAEREALILAYKAAKGGNAP